MGIISSNYGYVLAAEESTYGTDATPTAALRLTGRPTITSNRNIVERSRFKATAGGEAHGVIDGNVGYSFEVAVGGVEDADDGVPAVTALLVAAGLSEATSGTSAGGDVQADYTPLTVGHGSATIKLFILDKDTGNVSSITLLGARHNITLTWQLNNELLMQVDGEALYAEWSTFASGTNPTAYGLGITPFLCTGVTVSYDSVEYSCSNFTFATNWTVGRVDNFTGASNTDEVFLSRDNQGNRPGGSFNPVGNSTHHASGALLDDSRDGTNGALSVTFNDGTYNFSLTSSTCQIGVPSQGADGAFLRYEVPYFCNESSSGNDDFTMSFGLE